MNAARIAMLLRELADALEEAEPSRPRRRRQRVPETPRRPDELTQKRADQILKDKGILR